MPQSYPQNQMMYQQCPSQFMQNQQMYMPQGQFQVPQFRGQYQGNNFGGWGTGFGYNQNQFNGRNNGYNTFQGKRRAG